MSALTYGKDTTVDAHDRPATQAIEEARLEMLDQIRAAARDLRNLYIEIQAVAANGVALLEQGFREHVTMSQDPFGGSATKAVATRAKLDLAVNMALYAGCSSADITAAATVTAR